MSENAIYFDESSFMNISYYTEMLCNDKKFANATCFFIKDEPDEGSGEKPQWYLITNYHVVSGKNPDSGELLDDCGRVPETLRVFVPYREDENDDNWITDHYIDVSLYDEDGNKLWRDKKIGDRFIDVAVIPVKISDEHIQSVLDAEEPFNEDAHIELGSDVFIIGFPFGKLGGYLPIWKRASIASHVLIDIEGMPFFYADTATRSGMSGSPVVYYEKRPVTVTDSSWKQFSRHFTKLIGVYSGRIGTDSKEGDAQLGKVWRADVISDLIASSKGGEL